MGNTVTICFANNKGGSGKSHQLFQCRCGTGQYGEEGSSCGRRYAAESFPFIF